MKICPDCDGFGYTNEERLFCDYCDGTGRVTNDTPN